VILVDTSVLIDYFKGVSNPGIAKFNTVLEQNIPWGINTFIYQEILQGTSSEKEFILLKEYLDTQTFYELQGGRESFANAARNYYRCRRNGITVSSTIDFLIVQTALENDLALLQNDRDYLRINKIISELNIY
jgi:predicted nucleic acid-binding protein